MCRLAGVDTALITRPMLQAVLRRQNCLQVEVSHMRQVGVWRRRGLTRLMGRPTLDSSP